MILLIGVVSSELSIAEQSSQQKTMMFDADADAQVIVDVDVVVEGEAETEVVVNFFRIRPTNSKKGRSTV